MQTSATEAIISGSLNIEHINEASSIETQYKFEDFPVEIYSGKLSTPDFNNNPYA
jgi:hypothetical protein